MGLFQKKHIEPFITFAGIEIPRESEMKHFLAAGATGSGKSVAIREVLGCAAWRGDRCFIADPDGGYLSRFYNPSRGDVILNPFDARSVVWDMLAEAPSDPQADQLVESLMPVLGGASEQGWTTRARTLLSSIFRVARDVPDVDNSEIFRLFAQADTVELTAWLSSTAAAPLLAEGAEKLLAGVRGTCTSAIQTLEYVSKMDGGRRFSIVEWAKSDSCAWVFLPYQADQISALRYMISTWMRLAIFAQMSRGEGDFPTWFVTDELDALGKMEGIDDALQRVRKFGGRCILGFQTIQKLRDIYGEGVSYAMAENCANRLLLRCAGGGRNSTANWASEMIGEVQYWKYGTSSGKNKRTSGSTSAGVTESVSRTLVTESAVLPAQIEQLPEFGSGYFKTPSDARWLRLSYQYDVERKQHTPPFVQR